MGNYSSFFGSLPFTPGLSIPISQGQDYASFGQGLGTYYQMLGTIPKSNFFSYERFYEGCQRIIDEVKQKQEYNCLIDYLKEK